MLLVPRAVSGSCQTHRLGSCDVRPRVCLSLSAQPDSSGRQHHGGHVAQSVVQQAAIPPDPSNVASIPAACAGGPPRDSAGLHATCWATPDRCVFNPLGCRAPAGRQLPLLAAAQSHLPAAAPVVTRPAAGVAAAVCRMRERDRAQIALLQCRQEACLLHRLQILSRHPF